MFFKLILNLKQNLSGKYGGVLDLIKKSVPVGKVLTSVEIKELPYVSRFETSQEEASLNAGTE